MLAASTRIIPISPPRRVKQVTKLEDGGLRVELASGEVFTIDADEPLFQAFVVYTVLAEL